MSEEWVSITDAAYRLSMAGDRVDRSTLSRYLKQHAEVFPLQRDGKSNLVNFTALALHRSENIRIQVASTRAGRQTFDYPAPGVRSNTKADAVSREKHAMAEMREMDLGLRRRELTLVAEVEQGGRDAVAFMIAAYERAIDSNAADFSVRYGWEERLVRVALKQFSKSGLEVFHREIKQRLASGEDAADSRNFNDE